MNTSTKSILMFLEIECLHNCSNWRVPDEYHDQDLKDNEEDETTEHPIKHM